jgi:Tfp pilus assembly protein PilF
MQTKRHLSYARGYLELGLVAEAAAEIDRIDQAEQASLEVVAVRMAVLHDQKDWNTLAKVAGQFVRRSPGQAAAWVTWAYASRRSDSLVAAEQILLEAEQHHPAEPTIQFNLGCYACLRGDLVNAQRRVDRAIALEPKFVEAAATDPDLAALRMATGKPGGKQIT